MQAVVPAIATKGNHLLRMVTGRYAHPTCHTPIKRCCPLCGATTGNTLGYLKATLFDDCPLPGQWHIVACADCGFIFCDGDYSAATLEAYYATEGEYWSNAEIFHDPVSDRADNPGTYIRKHRPNPETAILDVGCGSGKLLSVLQGMGYGSLHGIDPGYKGSGNGSLDLRQGNIYSIPFHNQFDVVVSTHVLEHLWDIQGALAQLCSKMKKNGLLYLEVPDTERYFTSEFRYIIASAYEHINFFTEYHLTNLLFRYGIQTIEVVKTSADYGKSHIPCLGIVGVRTDECHKPTNPPPTQCAEKFARYLRTMPFFPIREHIPAFAGKKIYVWGITRYLQIALQYCDLNRNNLTGLIDSLASRRKYTVFNLPTYPPEHLKGIQDAVVLINALNAEKPIRQKLREIGFSGDIFNIW